MDPTSILIAGAAGAPTLTLVGVFIFLQSRKKSLQQFLQSPTEGNVSFPFEQSIHLADEWLARRFMTKQQKELIHQHKEALKEMRVCTQALLQPEHSAVYWVAKPDFQVLQERFGTKHSPFFTAVNEHLFKHEKKEWYKELLVVFRELAETQYTSAQALSQKILDKGYHSVWQEKSALYHTSIEKCLNGAGEEGVIELYNQAVDLRKTYKDDFPQLNPAWEEVEKKLERQIMETLNTHAQALIETTRLDNLPIVLAKLSQLKTSAKTKCLIHFEKLESLHWAWRIRFEGKLKVFFLQEAEAYIQGAQLADLPRRRLELDYLYDTLRYAGQISTELVESLRLEWQRQLEEQVYTHEIVGIRAALVSRDYDLFRGSIRQLQQAGISVRNAEIAVLYQLVETLGRFEQLDFDASSSTALQSGIELMQRQEEWFVKQVPEIWEQIQEKIKDWDKRWLLKWGQEQQWDKLLQAYLRDKHRRKGRQNDPVVMQAIESNLSSGRHKDYELYLSMWISLKRRSQFDEMLEASWIKELPAVQQAFFAQEAGVHIQVLQLLGDWLPAPVYAKRLGDYLFIFQRLDAIAANRSDPEFYQLAYAYWMSGVKVAHELAAFIDMREEVKLLQQSLENDSTAVLNRLCEERENGTFSLLKFPVQKQTLVEQIIEKYSREAMLSPPLITLEMLRKLSRLFVEEERIQRLFKHFVKAYLREKLTYEVRDLKFVVEGLVRFPQDSYFIEQFKGIVYNFVTDYLQGQGIFKEESRRKGLSYAIKEAQRERLIRVKQGINQLANAPHKTLDKLPLFDLRIALRQLFEALRSQIETQLNAFPEQVRKDFDLTFDGFLRAGRSTVYADRNQHRIYTKIGILLAECMVALEGIIAKL